MRIAFQFLSLTLLAGLALPVLAQDFGGRVDRKGDPSRIINESMQFLREREPDMTAEEAAIYQQTTEMLRDKPEQALRLLEGMVLGKSDKASASPAFDLLLGNVYYSSGDQAKAEQCYLGATRKFPSFLRAWVNLGVLYYAQARYEKAVTSLTKAVTLGQRESATYGMLAHSLEKLGNPVAAELSYIQALSLDPQNITWTEGLFRVYWEAGQYARAEIMARNLLREAPKETRFRFSYAKVLIVLDRRLEAIAALEQLDASGNAAEEVLVELADLYAREQMLPEALRTYGRIRLDVANMEEARALRLFKVLVATQNWDRASELLKALSPKLESEGGKTRLRASAELYLARKQWTEAKKALEELLSADPLNGAALLSLGTVHLKLGDEEHAILAFEAALQTKDAVRQASIALANLEIQRRHYDKSLIHLERALSLERNRDLEDILERVKILASKNGSPEV